jgi:hypothetical protein
VGNLRKMDSKQVTKEINSIIRPVLKENGFNKFTGRTYWRYKTDRIDILNFQSYNSYNAEVMGCTTFSFAVNLSTFLNYIPTETEIKEKNGLKRPAEYDGQFRSGIKKRIEQKEFTNENIWFINNDRNYLTSAITDCKNQIEKSAFQWYDQFDNKENVLRICLEDEMDMDGTWGFGNKDSYSRNRLIAFTANEMGDYAIALEYFEKVKSFLNENIESRKNDRHWKKYVDWDIKRLQTIQSTVDKIKTTHSKELR